MQDSLSRHYRVTIYPLQVGPGCPGGAAFFTCFWRTFLARRQFIGRFAASLVLTSLVRFRRDAPEVPFPLFGCGGRT